MLLLLFFPQLHKDSRVFVGLSLPDSRLTHGKQYYEAPLQTIPIAFDIMTKADMRQIQESLKGRGTITQHVHNDWTDKRLMTCTDKVPQREKIKQALPSMINQPCYCYTAVQVSTRLKAGEYVIVPSLYKK